MSAYKDLASKYEPPFARQEAFKRMGKDLVTAIHENQLTDNGIERSLELPEAAKDTIRLMLEDCDSQYRGFSEGWYSQLSGKSSEDVKSICSTAGLSEPCSSTSPSISDCQFSV